MTASSARFSCPRRQLAYQWYWHWMHSKIFVYKQLIPSFSVLCFLYLFLLQVYTFLMSSDFEKLNKLQWICRSFRNFLNFVHCNSRSLLVAFSFFFTSHCIMYKIIWLFCIFMLELLLIVMLFKTLLLWKPKDVEFVPR